MKKKLLLFLSISFIVFLITLYFYKEKQKHIEQYLKQVENMSTSVELEELKNIDSQNNINIINTGDSQQEKEKLLENMVANEMADINILGAITKESSTKMSRRYQKVYLYEIKKNNIYLAIKAVKRILKTTKHKDIWYKKIVELYIRVGDFENAEKYTKDLLVIDGSKETLKKYLYIRFQNVNFFDKKKIDEIQSLVVALYKKKIIPFSDFKFYNFLIELLTKWDVKNIGILIDDLIKKLDNPTQKQLISLIKNDLQIYRNKKGSPLYYFKSLVALDLLKFTYFGLSKNIAKQVYIQDSSYILPKQILAYSYFFMGDYRNAIKYFKELKNIKDINDEDYTFFMGISYYWLKQYKNSLLFLDQLKANYTYHQDVLRYKILIYIKLKNNQKVMNAIYKMSKLKLNYVDYYNIFKYSLITCKNCYKNNTKLLVGLIQNCYKDIDKNKKYVCWYGKANLFYNAGKTKYSIRYFRLLTKYFQDTYIYDIIAKYYEKKGDKKRARYFYLKELLYTSKTSKREILKGKIKKLLIK